MTNYQQFIDDEGLWVREGNRYNFLRAFLENNPTISDKERWLETANRIYCNPPLPDHEVEQIVRGVDVGR